MDGKGERILKDWYRKRTLTAITGIILKCIYSFEYSSITISGLYYYKYTFNLSNDAKLFYSLSVGILYFTSSVTAWIAGRYMDRTRNLRRIVIFAMLLSVAGNIVYSIPLSKWLPIIARGVCGIADCIQPAMTGELSRCYSKEKLGQFLSVYYVLGAMMYSIAPCSPALFKYINFTVGSLVVNKYNFVGLFQAGISLLALVFSLYAVCDLTKHPGYQLYLKTVEVAHTKTDAVNKSASQYLTLKDVLKDETLVILISGTGVLGYLYGQLEVIMNMVALYNFSWDISRLSILAVTGTSLASIAMLAFNQNCLKSAYTFYYLFVLCFIAAWISLCMVVFSTNGLQRIELLKLAIYEIFLVNMLWEGYGTEVYGKWLLFSVVSSNCRCFVDSIRHITLKMFLCLGILTAAFVYECNSIVLPPLTIVCFVYVIVLLFKRDVYFA